MRQYLTSLFLCGHTTIFFYLLHYIAQVATTLLVAGSTLPLWIPGQTLFASTRSYPGLVQSLTVQWLVPINAQ